MILWVFSGHPFCEEILPNIKSEPTLEQLEAIASRFITCHHRKETGTLLAANSFQVFAETVSAKIGRGLPSASF